MKGQLVDLSKVTHSPSGGGGGVLSMKARSLGKRQSGESNLCLSESPFNKWRHGEQNQNLRMESKYPLLGSIMSQTWFLI